MALPKLDTPRYELTVPSTNKKVVYRPYLVKEEKILMMAMESNDQNQMVRALKDVIASCTDNMVDVNDLAMFDLEYIFMQLRSKSSGETTDIGVKCSSCETKNDINIDLSKVKVNMPKDAEKKIKLTDNVGVVMKYPSINDILKIQNDDDTEVNKIFDIIASAIDYIYSGEEIFDAKDQSSAELKDFIDSLNTEQFNKIRAFIENMPSAGTTVEFDCKSCGTHNSIEVKGLANFFS